MTEQKTFRPDKQKIFWTAAALITLIIAFLGSWWRKSNPVKDIIVSIAHLPDGNDLIKEKDVKNLVERAFDFRITAPTANMQQVDVQRVEKVLEQDPFIQNAEAFFDISNQLNVRVQQRIPILRILDENGANYYLDEAGVKIPASKYFSVRVPVATGAIPPHIPDFQKRQKYLLKDLFFLTQRLSKDNFFASNIQQIHVGTGGDFILIPLVGDHKIVLGNLDDLEDKLSRVKIFYQEAIPYEGWKKYGIINVKYKGQVVCKKR
jgi:cell division protein FtsQ